ncbi:MAG: hypothetical protein JSW00_18375 [Thermoplasmata archaeon]|nr:MAG: hypothetical protein JSW00_18375 [Thermoplasmata archaeon]
MPKNPTIPKRFWEDAQWVRNNYSELLRKYPDRWIAVVGKKVICSGKNLSRVRSIAKRKTSRSLIYSTYIGCGHHVY